MSERVLVALDGSALAEQALPFATDIVQRTAGKLLVVRVHVPVVPLTSPSDLGALYYDPDWDPQARTAEERYVARMVASLRDGDSFADGVVVDGADIAGTIEAAAAEFDATLIVMTTHGHGGAALAWLGSVASGVVRAADRPVLVIPEQTDTTPAQIRRVFIGHDGTATSDAVIDGALALARVWGAAITLVRVVAPPLVGDVWTALSSEGLDRFGVDRSAEDAKQELDVVAARLRAAGLSVDAEVIVHANPGRALLDEIARVDADLVAVSTAGRGLSRLIVGSVADKLLRGSARPTLIRRPQREGSAA